MHQDWNTLKQSIVFLIRELDALGERIDSNTGDIKELQVSDNKGKLDIQKIQLILDEVLTEYVASKKADKGAVNKLSAADVKLVLLGLLTVGVLGGAVASGELNKEMIEKIIKAFSILL